MSIAAELMFRFFITCSVFGRNLSRFRIVKPCLMIAARWVVRGRGLNIIGIGLSLRG